MSQSALSFLAAGLLLAVGAHAVDIDEAVAPGSVASQASVGEDRRTVKIFVTLRDDAGRVLAKSSVRIESDDSPDIGVGPGGVKLSLPAARDATISVLFPGGNCRVTLTPKLIAGGRAAIGVGGSTANRTCVIEDAAQAGQAASAPVPASGAVGRPS